MHVGAHVERILRNAGRAGIPHDFTKEGLIDTICQTVRSTGLQDGSVRYYLTAGHGGFGWTPGAESHTSSSSTMTLIPEAGVGVLMHWVC